MPHQSRARPEEDYASSAVGITVPRRVEAGRVLTVAISIASSAFIAAGAWYDLQNRVEGATNKQAAIERRVKELEDARNTSDKTARDLELKSTTAIAVTAEQLREISRRLSSVEAKIDRLGAESSSHTVAARAPLIAEEMIVNSPVPVTRRSIVERARSVIGQGSYGFGHGGRVPYNSSPFDEDGLCDCSGFVAWSCGIDRYQPRIEGSYVETTGIVHDASKNQRLFARTSARRPGYLIVYPDRAVPDPANPSRRVVEQGHVGIVSAVDSKGHITKVIHCSRGNERRTGHCVAETEPTVFFEHKALVVRFRGALSAK